MTLKRLCRQRGLPFSEDRGLMIQELVQLKFYNRQFIDITQEQLQKYLQIYKHLVDKDQQAIIATQKQSFITQSQMMQEFLKYLQKRYMNIVNDSQGEEWDQVDSKLYDINKHVEHQKIEKNQYLNMDGKELTEEELKQIEDKKVQITTYYDLSYLTNNQTPQTPNIDDPIELEVLKFREKLQSKGVHSPMRIEEFVKAKRTMLLRKEQIRKDKEKQQQLLQQQQQKQSQQQQHSYKQYSHNNNNKEKKHHRNSSSESKRKHDKKSKHYRKRSRSDSRKKNKSYKQYNRK